MVWQSTGMRSGLSRGHKFSEILWRLYAAVCHQGSSMKDVWKFTVKNTPSPLSAFVHIEPNPLPLLRTSANVTANVTKYALPVIWDTRMSQCDWRDAQRWQTILAHKVTVRQQTKHSLCSFSDAVLCVSGNRFSVRENC